MGWFDEQIKQRKKADDEMFSEAFVGIADAVLGSKMSAAFSTDEAKAQGAIEEILKFYKVKPREIPDTVKGLNDRLEFLLRPHGIMRRNVNLDKGWYKDGIGAVLGTRKDDGSVVAFIPKGLSGYVYFDAATGKWVRLNKKTEALFEDEGICFYKPFPLKKLTIATLMRYIVDTLSTADFILVILATLAVSAIGLLSPKLNNLLMGTVVESENIRLMDAVRDYFMQNEQSTAYMDFDGYRVEFPDWWFNIRPSNTEPYLRFICEATSKELLDEKVTKVREILTDQFGAK